MGPTAAALGPPHMAPDPGREGYTVCCTLARAVPDAAHLEAIRDAVRRTHRCTLLATELLNLYVRDRLENHDGAGLERLFDANWLIKAFYLVSRGHGKPAGADADLKAVFDTHMRDTLDVPSRKGLTQALLYECVNLAAVGSTNVWMHFRKRVLAYTRTSLALDADAYDALSKDERRRRKLALLQVAEDVCRSPHEPRRGPEEFHAWADAQRDLLGLDTAVGEWDGRPLLYHLKARPHRFVQAMHTMSRVQHDAGRRAFALFPLRRSHVPRHMRFDQRVLDDLLGLGLRSKRDAARKASKAPEVAQNEGRAPKRGRDDPSLLAEKAEAFASVLDLRAAGVHRRTHFAFAFTTDGVSLHLNMERPDKGRAKAARREPTTMPKRGVHSIDALKAVTRLEALHVVGLDPGKVELVHAVDADDPRSSPSVRYTLAQRRRDLRTRQYASEVRRSRPAAVGDAEERLSLLDSKSPDLAGFAEFAGARRALMRERPEIEDFYAHLDHRDRRRKTRIKTQQSESRLVDRLRAMHPEGDPRTQVLAYGAWGLVAGRPSAACNRGNPPAVGAGLLKRLARDFVVVPTPEHHTSKTCVRCEGLCGPHPTLKTSDDKTVRGLRVCQHEGCGLLQNRDRTGATNIGKQFLRLLAGAPPLRAMSDEELALHKASVCLECDAV